MSAKMSSKNLRVYTLPLTYLVYTRLLKIQVGQYILKLYLYKRVQ